MINRIRYINNEKTLQYKGAGKVSVRLDDNRAYIKKGAVVMKVNATSSHKVKIKVKQILKGLGFKFTTEMRNR